MSTATLRTVLERFGLTQVEFAELLSVTPRTVSLWATGETQLPGPVLAYLRVLQLLGPDGVAAELLNLDRRKQMLDNGLYKIDFAGRAGWGDGVLVLQNGAVTGCDIGNVQYDGAYSFDNGKRVNKIELTIAVPPYGELVTGFIAGASGAKLPVIAECSRPDPETDFVASVNGQKVIGKIRKLRTL
jgi:Helix-turn-helix